MMHRNIFASRIDVALLIVRLSCGGMLLMHGLRSTTRDFVHIKQMLSSQGLPEVLAYGNFIGEVVGPLLLIIGLRARIAGLLICINMFLSVVIAHRDIAFARNDYGGWMIELNAFYFFTALAIVVAGAGSYAVSRSNKWD